MSKSYAVPQEPFCEVLLTTKEAATYLAVSPSTLAYWRAVGDGPGYARLGVRSIRYRRADLAAYAATYWPSGAPAGRANPA